MESLPQVFETCAYTCSASPACINDFKLFARDNQQVTRSLSLFLFFYNLLTLSYRIVICNVLPYVGMSNMGLLFSFFDFFAKEGELPPNGLFNIPHFIALGITLIIVAILFVFTKNFSEKRIRNITFGIGIFFLILEIIKILYKFIINDTEFISLIEWMPLFFCSLFIYAALLSRVNTPFIRKISDAYIGGGALIGGLVFLICPTTSLPSVPLFHFLSIHSFVYHGGLVYCSLLYLYNGLFKPTWKNYPYYLYFTGIIITYDLLINILCDSNLMLLSEPINFPVEIIYQIYDAAPIVFTLGSLFVYLFLIYLASNIIYHIFFAKRLQIINKEKLIADKYLF